MSTPRTPRPFVVFGFLTTHDALGAEAVLKTSGIPVVPIPAPPSLGELCGIAMRVELAYAEEARELLVSLDLDPATETVIQDV